MSHDPTTVVRPADRPIARPLMIFDGDCGFCRRAVGWMKRIAGDRADYAPAQEVGREFPSIPPAEFTSEVKFVETDGRVYGGAEAVFRLIFRSERGAWSRVPLWIYRSVPGARWASEMAYRFVAAHRTFFSWLTRWL